MSTVTCRASCCVCSSLRDGMIELTGAGGFASVALEDLAARVGIPVAEAQTHVASLDQLLADAYTELADRLLEHYAAAFLAGSSWSDRFATGAQSVFEIYRLEPGLARVCHLEVPRAGELTRAAGDASKLRWVAFVADALRDVDDVPPLHFELVCGALNQAVKEAVRDRGIADTDALRERIQLIAETLQPVST